MTVTSAAVVALGLVLGVRALLAILERPQRGVLLLVALVPFDGLLLILALPPQADYWKLTLVLVVVVCSLLPGPGRAPGPWLPLPAMLWPLLALLVLGASSALLGDLRTGIVGWRVEFAYTLIIIPLLRAPLTSRDRDRLITILMVTGVVVAAVGIWQQIVGPARLNELGYPYNDVIRTANGRLRSFSTFNQPFPFAFWLMSVLCLVTPVVLAQPRRPRNLAFLLVTPVLLLGTTTAIVRGALLGLAAAGLLLFVQRRVPLWPLLTVGLIVLLLTPAGSLATFLSPDSLGERTGSWTANFSELLSRPLGHGVGSSGSAAELLEGQTARGRAFQPDNAYYNAVYQLGPLGGWLLLRFLYGLLRQALSTARAGVPAVEAGLCIGTAMVTAAVAAAGLVANYFQVFPAQLLVWLAVGMLAALVRDQEQQAVGTAEGRVRHVSAQPVPAAGASPPDAVPRA